MQNSGVNIIAIETYSAFSLFQFASFWCHARSIIYLLLLFASLGTLYEPSSGTQILTIVYNDTLFFFFLFFCYQQCGLPPGKSQGRLFQTTGFKTAKTGFNRFCPCY